MIFFNERCVSSFLSLSPKTPFSEFYSNGKVVVDNELNKTYKKITTSEISKLITGFVDDESKSLGEPTSLLEKKIRNYECLLHRLMRVYFNETKSTFSFLKDKKPLKCAIKAVSVRLNNLCEKTFVDIEGISSLHLDFTHNAIANTLIKTYNWDLDRASDDVPQINGKHSADALASLMADILHILGKEGIFDAHEQYVIKTTLSELRDIFVRETEILLNSEEGKDRLLGDIIDSICHPQGTLIPGMLEAHFVIASIEPQGDEKYRFSITNAGGGILNNHYEKMGVLPSFQTTLTFSGIPSNVIKDAELIGALIFRKPIDEAYCTIRRLLGDYLDPVSKDSADFRKPQKRGTCASRSIYKWLHQSFYEKGCEGTYRKLRHQLSLLTREELQGIQLDALEPGEEEDALAKVLKNPNEDIVGGLRGIVVSMLKEHGKVVERRKIKAEKFNI